MILDRLQRDEQSVTDLLVGQSSTYLTYHFALSFGYFMFCYKGLEPGFKIIRKFTFQILKFVQVDVHEKDWDQVPGEEYQEKELQEKRMIPGEGQGCHAQDHKCKIPGAEDPDVSL